MTRMRKETTVNKRPYKYTLKDLAQMFVDYDRIGSQDWDERYSKKAAVLSKHFNMPPELGVIDTLRTAMETVLNTGKALEIRPDERTPSKD